MYIYIYYTIYPFCIVHHLPGADRAEAAAKAAAGEAAKLGLTAETWRNGGSVGKTLENAGENHGK